MKYSLQYSYFETSFRCIIKRIPIIILVTVLDQLIMLIELIKSSTFGINIFYVSQQEEYEAFNREFFLNKINLLFYFRKLKLSKNAYPFYYILFIAAILVIHIFYYYVDKFKKIEILNKIIINFYQFFFFRIFTLFIYDIIINSIIVYSYGEDKNVIKNILSALLFCIFLYFFLKNYSHVFTYLKIQKQQDFPFDYVSGRNDLFFLITKIFIVILDNLYSNNFSKPIISFFLILILLCQIAIFFKVLYFIIYYPSFLVHNFVQHRIKFSFLLCSILWNIAVIFNAYKDTAYFYIIGIAIIIFSFVFYGVFTFEFFCFLFLNNMNEVTEMIMILFLKDTIDAYKIRYIERMTYHISQCGNMCDFCKINSLRVKNSDERGGGLIGRKGDGGQGTRGKGRKGMEEGTPTQNCEMNHHDALLAYYYDIFLTLFKQKCNKGKGNIKSKESISLITIYASFFSVLEYSFFKRNTTFKFRYYLTFLINKYSGLDVTVSMNLFLFYKTLFENKTENDKTLVKEMNLYIILIEKLTKIISRISSHIVSETKSPKEFLSLGYEVYHLKDKDHVKFLIKRQKSNDYSIALITYLLEEITNVPTNKERGMIKEDILLNEELLQYHFCHNQNIILAFNPVHNYTIIKKAGKDMIKYVGTDFVLMFPKEFRDEGISKFRASLNQDSEIKTFDFILYYDSTSEIIKDKVIDQNISLSTKDNIIKHNPKYVRFYMNYKLFYEDLNSDFYLNGEYRFDSNEIVISKLNKDSISSPQNEYILEHTIIENQRKNMKNWIRNSLSETTKRKRFSIITNEAENTIEYLHAINIKNINESITSEIIKKKKIKKKCIKLSTLFFRKNDKIILLKDEFTSQCNIRRDKHDKSGKINPLFLSHQKNAFFLLYSIDTFSYLYKVYVKIDNLPKDKVSQQTKGDIGTTLISVFENETRQGTIQINDSSSLCFSTSNSSVVSYLQKERNQMNLNIDKIYKQYQERFVSITKLTLIFCLIIITFSIISLIIELQLNEKLLKSYKVYTELRALNRLFYNTITSFLAVICIGLPGQPNCINYYKQYNEKFNQLHNLSYPSFNYSVYENPLKLADFGSMLSKLKKSIYDLDDPKANALFSSEFNYSYLSIVGEKIEAKHQTVPFVNALEMLFNGLTIMAENDKYIKGSVYIFTLGTFDFSNVYDKANLESWQYEYYNLVMNYQKYLDNWVNIQISLSDNTNGKLNNLSRIVIIFLNVSNIFHIFLFCLLFYFIYNFENLFIMNTNKLMLKFEDDTYMKFFKQKYAQLKVLVRFFEKDPVIIIKDINSLYSEFTKTNMVNKMQSMKNVLSTSTERDKRRISYELAEAEKKLNYFPKKQYREITHSFYTLIICILIYYVVLVAIFLMIWTNESDKILLVFQIITENTVSACSGYNVFALCQIMLLANQTQSEISKNMKHNGDDYLLSESLRSINNIIDLEGQRNKVKSLMQTTNDFLDLNCDTFYDAIKDSRFTTIANEHPNEGFRSEYASFCKEFHIMEYKKDLLFYKSVFYQIDKFACSISRMWYSDIIDQLENGHISFMCYL